MSIDPEVEFVRALARGLEIIECFEGEQWPISLSEVAKRTKLPRGSARRLLLTLQQLGYVDSIDGRFFLRARVLRLGHAYLTSNPLNTMATEVLRRLADSADESCALAELDGEDIVYLARSSSRRIIKDYIEIGRRMPAYPTSMGRVLLAEFDDAQLDAYLARTNIVRLAPGTTLDRDVIRNIIVQARQTGWAISDEEIEVGRRAIAVPVRNRDGKAVAAINISAVSPRYTCEELVERFAPMMRQAADELSRMLVWSSDRLRSYG